MPSFTMQRMRDYALGMIVVLNALATVVSFGESYAGLYRWAIEHGVAGFWGGVWPMMVDLIILVAEAGLFVAHHDKWHWRHKAWLWSVMFTALGVSTGGNTGHVHSTDYLSHLTAALPPVALMFATTVGFGVMKRTFMHKTPGETRAASQPLTFTENASPSQALTLTSQPLTPPAETVLTPVSQPLTESLAVTVPDAPATETAPAASVPEMTDPRLSGTMVKLGFKVTEKSYSQPPDPRQGLNPAEMRVRDMYDLDPDISVNAIATALGISWATAKKYLEATKEARGITT